MALIQFSSNIDLPQNTTIKNSCFNQYLFIETLEENFESKLILSSVDFEQNVINLYQSYFSFTTTDPHTAAIHLSSSGDHLI